MSDNAAPKWANIFGMDPNFHRHPAVREMHDFLIARIELDEAVIGDMRHHAMRGVPLVQVRGDGTGVRDLTSVERMAAECSAKRAVVSDITCYGESVIPPEVKTELLYAMAQVYSAHPDFYPSWIHGKVKGAPNEDL